MKLFIYTVVLMQYLSCFLVSSALWANSEEPSPKIIKVASEHWPDFVNPDGTGLYFEIIKAVYEPVGIAVQLTIEPFKRARLGTVQQHHDVVIGTYSQAYRGNDLLLTPQYPINTERVLAIYHKDSTLDWARVYQRNKLGADSAIGYTIAWIIGYNYDQYLGIKKGLELRRSEQGLKMLVQRRLAVFLEPEDEALVLLRKEFVDLQSQLRWETVLTRNIYLAFSHNARGKQLCKIYDQRLPQLYKDGVLQALFKKWQVDFTKLNVDWQAASQDNTFCEPLGQP
ncbi:substrate-binding periplasmic protein [Dasania marina]|uniref:substrate-binding periplasmic protein n=1 Tax=Dasania marina TaxID=471499 RepID=UPI0003735E95|nr:transporter substrate-binding domain-containing protein [Dasania marina]